MISCRLRCLTSFILMCPTCQTECNMVEISTWVWNCRSSNRLSNTNCWIISMGWIVQDAIKWWRSNVETRLAEVMVMMVIMMLMMIALQTFWTTLGVFLEATFKRFLDSSCGALWCLSVVSWSLIQGWSSQIVMLERARMMSLAALLCGNDIHWCP